MSNRKKKEKKQERRKLKCQEKQLYNYTVAFLLISVFK